MELPSRPKADRYTRPGEYNELERRLRANPACGEMPVLVTYAFDWRTRLGPFLYADMRLLNAGPRAVAAALHSAGFTKVRIVQRQWNRELRPSEARFDGAPPQMLLVSSMQIHSASAYELIADAYRLGEARPLILAGGAKAIYERHNQEVRDAIPKDRLVEWKASQGWEPLCAALGLPVPNEPFPLTNTTEEWLARRA